MSWDEHVTDEEYAAAPGVLRVIHDRVRVPEHALVSMKNVENR